jgi:hypothetical protein
MLSRRKSPGGKTPHGRRKMNKFTSAFLAAVVAAMGFALLLTACEVFTVSENVESLPLPPRLPVAHILDPDGNEAPVGSAYGDYQFELTWVRTREGVLSASNDFSAMLTDDDYIKGPLPHPELPEGGTNVRETGLRGFYHTWKDYTGYTEPIPFRAEPNSYLRRYVIWLQDSAGTWKLDNTPSDVSLIIQRYWPRDWEARGLPPTPTVAAWPGTNALRKAAYLEAKKKIEAMMVDIKASAFYPHSFYLEGSSSQVYPLQEVYKGMGQYISESGIPANELYQDLGPWTPAAWENRNTTPMRAGNLYELYFGHIPTEAEYLVTKADDPSAEYVFPME